MKTVYTRFELRRGTASKWTLQNPVLLDGELGIETDTRRFKFGDGQTAWSSLNYASFDVQLKTTAPTTVNGYDPGQIWINTTNGTVYILTDVIGHQKEWQQIYLKNDIDTFLANKVDVEPLEGNPLFDENGKLNFAYIPDSIVSGLVYGGVVNGSGIITASNHTEALDGLNISAVDTADYPGYFFIFTADYTFDNVEYNTGDWIISQGTHTPGWAKIDNSDKVSSVNDKTGAVGLNTDDISEKTQGAANLYYTSARFSSDFALKTSEELADGSNILKDTDTIIFDGGYIE